MFRARSLIEDSLMVSGASSSRGVNNTLIPDILTWKPTDDGAIPRKAVIDACNVAHAASGRGRKKVACDGLLALVRYLLIRGFDAFIFIPIHYRTPMMDNVEHAAILEHLERLDLLTFTTARKRTEERAGFQNYDDLFILSYAEQCGGFVLSGDHYEDVLRRKEYAHMHRVIRNRRVEPLWRDNPGKPFARTGIDRFGRRIPDLITHTWNHYPSQNLSDVFFCCPGDPNYEKVRQTISSEQAREKLIVEIDKLMDELERTGAVHSLTVSNSARQLFPRSSSFSNQRSRAEFESSSLLEECDENLSELFSAASVHDLISPALPSATQQPSHGARAYTTQAPIFYLSEPKEEERKIKKKEDEDESASEDSTDRLRREIRARLSDVFEKWVVDQAMEECQNFVDIALIAARCTAILDSLPH